MSDASARSGDKKRRQQEASGPSTVARADAYDTHGNELLGLHMQEAQHKQGTESDSLLALAASQLTETERVSEGEQVEEQGPTEEQVSDIDEDEELMAAHAEGREVDGEVLKQGLLDGAGSEMLLTMMNQAQSEMEMPPMNPDAQRKVLQQVEGEIDVRALSAATSMDEVGEVMRQALRDNALRAREEVMLLLMRLMASPKEMEMIAGLSEKGDRSIQVIEYLAEYTAELDDLHALAAYDHKDLLHRVPAMSSESLEIKKFLSPMALQMGSFAPVVFQLLCNELDRLPGGGKAREVEGEEQADTTGMGKALTNLLNDMRLARFLQG